MKGVTEHRKNCPQQVLLVSFVRVTESVLVSLPTLPAGPLYRVTAARKVTDFVYLYYLSLCKLVAKVNYNMFQSQTFRMWRRHAAATKNNDGRNYTCVRKTQTNQSCGSAGGIKFHFGHSCISIDLVTRRRRWVWYVTLQLCMKVAGRITFIRTCSNDGGPSGSKFGTVG